MDTHAGAYCHRPGCEAFLRRFEDELEVDLAHVWLGGKPSPGANKTAWATLLSARDCVRERLRARKVGQRMPVWESIRQNVAKW